MEINTYIADLAALLGDIAAESIISRKILKNDEVHATLFGFAAGQELTEHTASRPAMLHFLSGRGTITLGAESHPAGAGTFVYMPAHLPHSIIAETELQMLLVLLLD
jgi:quercetin dioxygenase-like cupin family protein